MRHLYRSWCMRLNGLDRFLTIFILLLDITIWRETKAKREGGGGTRRETATETARKRQRERERDEHNTKPIVSFALQTRNALSSSTLVCDTFIITAPSPLLVSPPCPPPHRRSPLSAPALLCLAHLGGLFLFSCVCEGGKEKGLVWWKGERKKGTQSEASRQNQAQTLV